MRLLLSLVILLAAGSAGAQEATKTIDDVIQQATGSAEESLQIPKTFNAQSFTLANGMQVVVIPNHRAPVVTHMIWYKVGSADEKPGLSGMAHYLEHLLFKGTPSMAPGAYSKRVRVMGGNDNAFTSQDFTAFYATVSVDNLMEVMKMEADRMLNISPPPEHYASEKTVVLEERRERTENDPRARFSEQLQSLLYINHPYGKPIIGWMDEIKLYDWPHVKTFYDTWYAPNNAILIVSGDMTAERLKPAAEAIYGGLAPKELPPRVRPAIPPAPAPVTLRLADPSVHQPALQIAMLAPAYAQNKKDSLALQVLEEILDGGPTTRLYDSLVVKQKKAVSVSFSYDDTALDYGSIGIYIIPAPGVALEDIEKQFYAEIDKVLHDGVTQTEVAEAIKRLQEDAIYARDSLSGPAMIIGYALTTGSSLDDIENWPSDIATVSVDDIKRVAGLYLDRANPWLRPSVTGYLLPGSAAASAKDTP